MNYLLTGHFDLGNFGILQEYFVGCIEQEEHTQECFGGIVLLVGPAHYGSTLAAGVVFEQQSLQGKVV